MESKQGRMPVPAIRSQYERKSNIIILRRFRYDTAIAAVIYWKHQKERENINERSQF